jgi:peptide/nickel transport system ATP-binding protein
VAERVADIAADEQLLAVKALRVEYVAGATRRTLVDGVDLEVARGETIAVVGESGSGKTLTARAIIRLLPTGVEATGGEVIVDGRDVLGLSAREGARLRGNRVSMIFQDPFTMLNPVLRCAGHIEEVLRNRPGVKMGKKEARQEALLRNRPGVKMGKKEARQEALRRLAEVGIHDPTAADRYPFQLSGGMRQRVGLAAALAGDPELLIADEPSTALDVTTQAEILALLKEVQRSRGMGLVLITHDLRVAFSVADRVYVLYAGSLVEVSHSAGLEHEPLHPYSLGLLLSEPATEFRQETLLAVDGSVPAPDDVQTQCSFAERCRWVAPECVAERPPLRELEPGRLSACARIEAIRGEMDAVRHEVRVAAAPAVPVAGPGAGESSFVTITDLRKVFAGRSGTGVAALAGVSIAFEEGESVGIVGESGSGKTTLGRCLVGLETPTDGSISVGGLDASDYGKLSRDDRARLRRTVQIVFQDPYSTLDATQTIGAALREALLVNGFAKGRVGTRVDELLECVGLPLGYAKRRPAALSGGERQRVAIARTLAVEPKLLVCDEPVSALDVSVQAQILNLFRDLREQFGLGYLFITHDLAVVRQVVDRVYVLHQGRVVEQGPVDRVLDAPEHPYTERLIASIPRSAA